MGFSSIFLCSHLLSGNMRDVTLYFLFPSCSLPSSVLPPLTPVPGLCPGSVAKASPGSSPSAIFFNFWFHYFPLSCYCLRVLSYPPAHLCFRHFVVAKGLRSISRPAYRSHPRSCRVSLLLLAGPVAFYLLERKVALCPYVVCSG